MYDSGARTLPTRKQAALRSKWAEGLTNGENKLGHLIDAVQEQLEKREGEAPQKIVLYVDQGEELYTHSNQKVSRRLSELLADAATDRRLLIFSTLRADFFDELQADQALFGCHTHIDVRPLDRDKIRDMVVLPARALDATLEDERFVERLVTATHDSASSLPLLSYLLDDAWRTMVERGDAVLRLPAKAIDVGGVLSGRAEQFLKENSSDEKPLRRLLTLKLAIIPPEGEPLRRQTSKNECGDLLWNLAGELANIPWRLVVMREREGDGVIIAEVAHEALLRTWPRLAEWLKDEREFLVFKSELERRERDWQKGGRGDQLLLTGLDLLKAKEVIPKRAEDLSEASRKFASASIAADRRAAQRQIRRAIGTAAAMTVLGAVAAYMSWLWSGALDVAQDQLRSAQIAQSRFLAERARRYEQLGDSGTGVLAILAGFADGSALPTWPLLPESELLLDTMAHNLRERRVLGLEAPASAMAYDPAHDRLALGFADHIRIRQSLSETPVGIHVGDDTIRGLAFNQDGTLLVVALEGGKAQIWNATDAKRLLELEDGQTGAFASARFSKDGKYVVTASFDGVARVWDAASGEILRRLTGHETGIVSASFSPDGQKIVTASTDGTARIWSVSSETTLHVLADHTAALTSAAFSPRRDKRS